MFYSVSKNGLEAVEKEEPLMAFPTFWKVVPYIVPHYCWGGLFDITVFAFLNELGTYNLSIFAYLLM